MTCRASPRDGTTDPVSMTAMAPTPSKSTTQPVTSAEMPPVPTDTTPPSRYHSKSMPSTPLQKSHTKSSQQRSPSLGRTLNNASPRSTHSDSSQTPPASRKVHGGCKYETGMAKARRRVPYSLGPDKLPPDPARMKRKLGSEEEQKLSKDMQTLYHQLLPSRESEARRTRVVEKFETILRNRWPESSITVNVFGSTGNNLGTSDSDVDICITTNCKELSRVCSIAELLANNGMERVVCVSSAKVPIVKVWDPELQVACDLNVNNPIALENTALIKSYIDIDSRVRPLAMIIKHWAKRRILNDAALGGTLSSYTWICLTLNFLQTREPPVIPSLQNQPNLESRILDGVNVAFDKDLDMYKDFGAENKSTLGELLYQFFRFYAFELDFEEKVLSVRLGSLMPKSDKGWHLLQDNRLCVEEPFNISRNLANTADDTSMRGIHLELRRAFALVADGQLDQCCRQYIYPPEEPKSSEHFVPPTARPVIPQPPHPVRGAKVGGRGGRNANHLNRNNIAGRRSSNPMARTPMTLRNLPFQMTTQELQLQAQHQQHLLHDQLFQQFQYLQLQEQELRARLNQQRQRSMLSQASYNGYPFGQYQSQDENAEGSNAASRAPLSAPLYQQRFAGSPFLNPALPVTGVATNPSSPHLSPALPDTARFSRRTSVTQSVRAGSLRAQSQPARTLATPMAFGHLQAGAEVNDYLAGRRSSSSSTSHEIATGYSNASVNGTGSSYETSRRPAEYVGYYVGQSPSLLGYPQSASISPVSSQVGLAIQNGGLSPRLTTSSPPPSFTGPNSVKAPSETASATAETQELPIGESKQHIDDPLTSPKKGPLIVDGSINSPRRRRIVESSRDEHDDPMTFSASTSEDLAFDTPSSSDEHSQEPADADRVVGEALRSSSDSARTNSDGQGSMNLTNGHTGHLSIGHVMVNGGEVNQYDPPVSDKAMKPTLLPWSLGRQLSAVEEVRTPSPSVDRGNGSPTSPRSTVHAQGHSKARQDDSKRSSQDVGALFPRPNGLPVVSPGHDAIPATTSSSWQTQKKKKNKKKTVKSENDVQGINDSGGDLMPTEESQRKGG